jgi:tRNA/rRNA methyltransferase
VLLIGYEWLKLQGAGTLGREPVNNAPIEPGLSMRDSRPATKSEMIGFLEHLERELDESGFLRPPEKRPVMIRNIRALFERTSATEQEIRTLRGIVASLVRTHKRPR